jgi:hypothetical protein
MKITADKEKEIENGKYFYEELKGRYKLHSYGEWCGYA